MINLRLRLMILFVSSAVTAALGSITPRADAPSTFTAAEQAQGFVNGRILVKLRSDVSDTDARETAAEGRTGITNRRIFQRLTGQRVLEFDRTKSVSAVIKELRATGLYEIVEPDRILHSRVVPNDPSFSQQWSLNNTGQTGGTAGADIGAPAAWNLQTDASNVIVAVVDSGIRLTHTDLKANLWFNPTPGSNGFTNDLNGINAINGSGNPNDDNGHGSHVAGIIGAVGNNANSISGVAWKAKLMALKFLASDGSGTTSDAITCLDYAIAHGVSVINASYGTTVFSASELAALQRVHDAGIIFVAAAGNDGLNTDNGNDYPAAYSLDNIVTVAATTNTDALASYSDYGSGSVDLAAPGDNIFSTYNTSDTATATLSGTSMATPHVTGALALLKAHFPNDTYRQLINRLLRSTTKLPGLSGKVQSGGRLNLAQALASTDNRPFNDDFATRAQLSGANVLVRSSNVGATREAGEPNHAGVTGSGSLWWTWTAPSTSTVTFDTSGSTYDTALAIYTGSGLGSLQVVGANDDTAPGTVTSSVTLSVVAGTTYQIAIDGKNGTSGLTVLRIASRPDNDNFSSAETVNGTGVSVTASNLYATKEPGEPNPAGAAAGHSVWYKWAAPANGSYSLSVFSTADDTVAGVYTGSSLSNLTLLAANDDSAAYNTNALVTFKASAGVTYYFLIDNNATDSTSGGAFTMTLTDSLWQMPAADQVTSSPAVGSDGTIYFGSLDGYFYATNPDGSSKWESTVGTRTGIVVDLSTPAIGADGTIYVESTDRYLYAINPTTGSRKWRFLTTTALYSSPAIATDGTIYVRDDSYLYALTSNTSSATKKWSVALSGGGTYGSPAIAADGTVYVGAASGNFFAINPTGTVKWTFVGDNDIYATPVIGGDGTVYFATLSGTVYALNPDGTKKWSWSIGDGSGITSSPAIGADGTLYFGAYDHKLHALRSTGTEAWSYPLGDEVRASSPAIAADGTIYVGCYDSLVYAITPAGRLQRTFATAGYIRSSPVIANGCLYFGSTDFKLYAFTLGQNAATTAWPMFHQNAVHNGRALTPPSLTLQPTSQNAAAGASLTLTTAAAGTPTPTYQWQFDGSTLAGATSSSLTLANLQPANAGLYTAIVTNGATTTSDPAIVGVSTTSEVVGAGTVLATHTLHPNGNYYDQVLLTGAAETIKAPGYVVRTSFIDLNDDIVQVEFSGAGTLSIVLDNPTGPAAPVNYNQPSVAYMKGHAGIVVTGADDTTNLLIFTVGRATAFDLTGAFNILLPVSATNNPANNGNPIFQGHTSTAYNGVADIAFIAISSTNGKFGGLRASDASCLAAKGLTGIYAPGVAFTGPVYISDINASDAASPVFIIGSSPDTRITGGDLLQANGQAVKVSGLTRLTFTAGGTSNNVPLPAQTNKAVLQQNGTDVTAQVVVNPSP